jgi:hypothetical protein
MAFISDNLLGSALAIKLRAYVERLGVTCFNAAGIIASGSLFAGLDDSLRFGVCQNSADCYQQCSAGRDLFLTDDRNVPRAEVAA